MECNQPQGLLQEIYAKARQERIPISVFIEITSACNIRCGHCYLRRKDEGKELNTDQWKRFIDQMAELGSFFLTISGGEPLLRPDAEEIFAHAQELGFFNKLFTNGMLLDERRVESLARLDWYGVEVSIQGADAATHDAFTGCPGSFELATQGMKMLTEAGVPVTLKSNFHRGNFRQLAALRELAEELGANTRLGSIVTIAEDGDTEPLQYRMTEEELLEFSRIMVEDAYGKKKPQLGNRSGGQYEALSCNVLRIGINVHPDGSVVPCPAIPMELGNIILQNPSEIWYSNNRVERLLALGKEIVPECAACQYEVFCNRCPGNALVEDGSVLLPGNEECRQARMVGKVVMEL